MRLKLYYTADEITNNLYTYGSEFMTEDNVEYIGSYHSYLTGEVYTGATWNAKLSRKLVTFRNISDKITEYQNLKSLNLQYELPQSHIVSITNQHMTDGIINRYFISKINDNIVFEIDITQYEKWISNKIDNVIYLAVMIPWTIAGAIDDTRVNGVLVPGVRSKNILQIQSASKKIPSITNILTNPIQFYLDTTFTVPKDINE
jgi:hypothetical protein